MPIYYKPKLDFGIVGKEEIMPYIEKAPDEHSKTLIALVWLTGMRVSEALRLTKERVKIDENEKIVMIVNESLKKGKTGYPTFAFSDPFADIIINFFKANEKIKYSKRRHQMILKKLNETIHGSDKSKYITFHYLRHSRITYLARVLGATPEEIKSWTGHRSTAFEEYYRPRTVKKFAGRLG